MDVSSLLSLNKSQTKFLHSATSFKPSNVSYTSRLSPSSWYYFNFTLFMIIFPLFRNNFFLVYSWPSKNEKHSGISIRPMWLCLSHFRCMSKRQYSSCNTILFLNRFPSGLSSKKQAWSTWVNLILLNLGLQMGSGMTTKPKVTVFILILVLAHVVLNKLILRFLVKMQISRPLP